MMRRLRRPPPRSQYPSHRREWTLFFHYDLPNFLWQQEAHGAAILRQYTWSWLQQRWIGVPHTVYLELFNVAMTTLLHRAEAREQLIQRPEERYIDHIVEPLPFMQLDDEAFMEATQTRSVVRLTRRSLREMARRYVMEELGQVPRQSRYTESYLYRLRPNHLELLVNLRLVWSRMSAHVFGNDREYRVRLIYEMQERQLDRITRQTPVFRSTAEWQSDEAFASFYRTVVNMFVSNDRINIFDIQIALDVYGLVAGGGVGSGGHRKSTKIYQPELQPRHLKSIHGLYYVPDWSGGLCGWMCLYAALHAYNTKTLGFSDRWMRHAAELREECGDQCDYFGDQSGCLFVAKYTQYRVVVFDSFDPKPRWYWCGGDYEKTLSDTMTIYLFYDILKQHMHWIKFPNAFFRQKPFSDGYVFCHHCFMRYPRAGKLSILQHHCSVDRCRYCGQVQPGDHHAHGNENCLKCNQVCYEGECLETHMLQCKRALPSTVSKCINPNCRRLFQKSRKSDGTLTKVCTQCHFCLKCYRFYQSKRHTCYWVNKTPRDRCTDEFWVFDFESMLIPDTCITRRLETGEWHQYQQYRHEVNYIVCRQIYHDTELSFNDLHSFVEFLRCLVYNEKKHVYMIAHNMKGYDGRLLFSHLVEKEGHIPTNVIWRGSKILGMGVFMDVSKKRQHTGIVFRDSLCHILAPLSAFPKIFGLDESRYKKGFFPYLFNTPEHQTYVGPIPAIHYFQPDLMSPAKRREFIQWYDEQQHTTYHFRHELETYCQSDVCILANALKVYMDEGLQENGFSPFTQMTIASYALAVYKNGYLKENMVGYLSSRAQLFARRALYGGKTDVRQMLKYWSVEQVKQGRYGIYQDVQSLYPTIQYYDPLPVGHPTLTTYIGANDEIVMEQPTLQHLETFFGFVCCDIRPTRYLHHPVLVEKKEGKLIADLTPKHRYHCTSIELQLALKHGYVVTRVYEIHEYVWSTDLFKDYVKKFLKLKIEAGGMPSYVKTEADWTLFANEHQQRLGIVLEKSKMIKNAGRKQLAKLMLNSLWGKFAQRGNFIHHETLRTRQDFLALERSWDSAEIDIVFTYQTPQLADQTPESYVLYRRFTDVEESDFNVAIAAFVTAHGRCRLLEQLLLLGERVIYHDTDSIIYERDPAGYNIPVGRYLGEWEDELGGHPIMAFVSTGPKTYSFKTVQPDPLPASEVNHGRDEVIRIDDVYYRCVYHSKAKGFTLNTITSEEINFKGMQDLVLGQRDYLEAVVPFFQYKRDGGITSYDAMKYLKFAYDKGQITEEFKVIPFGTEYVNEKDSASKDAAIHLILN